MIPLKDEIRTSTFPFVNILLILVNAALFAYELYLPGEDVRELILKSGFIPYELFYLKDISPANLLPAPLTIFSSMFLHGGWFHFLGNMLYLWIFGDNVEDALGHVRYLFFYMTCGTVAALAQGLTNPLSQVPLIGASGAIAGVLGAYLFLFPGAKVKTLFVWIIFVQVTTLPAFILLLVWIGMQVLSAYTAFASGADTSIAWFAHIGGFFTGFALAIRMKKKRKQTRRKR